VTHLLILRYSTTLRTTSPVDESGYNARLLGYTPEGGPIIQFTEAPAPLDGQTKFVSTDGDGRVIVAFNKDMTVVVKGEEGRHPRSAIPPSTAACVPPAQPILERDQEKVEESTSPA
jgi:hypothetical protein